MNAPNELPKNRGLLKLAAASLFFLLAALQHVFSAVFDLKRTSAVWPGSPEKPGSFV